MPTNLDRRRLADGARAMALTPPKTAEEIRRQLDVLHDSICALQSLDDLGSAEANQRAWDDMITLQQRYAALKATLKEIP